MKVLLTNSGRRTYMVQYLRDIREKVDYTLEIAVADTSIERPAMMMGEDIEVFRTPRVDIDPISYADELLSLCMNNQVDLVIPLMDYELPILARKRKNFEDKGIAIVVSNTDTIDATLNKRRFYEIMMSAELPVPKSLFEDQISIGFSVPSFLKPVEGSGSVGIIRIDNQSEMPKSIPKGYFLQKMIDGIEYGMDIFNDMSGVYVHSTLKRKIAMRCGETDTAEVLPNNAYKDFAKRLSKLFAHRGNLDVDFLVDSDGFPWFIDANPRFGGGYPFTHEAGVNYLRYLTDLHAGRQLTIPSAPRPIMGAKGIELFFKEIES